MKDTLILQPSQAGYVAKGRRELKDEQLFARLIGAAVLLALAVIVLPFVLDGSGSQREYEYAETLPVEPPKPIVERSFSSRQPASPTVQAPTRSEVEVSVRETTNTADLQAPAASTVSFNSAEQLANSVATAASTGVTTASTGVTTANGATGSAGLDSVALQPGWNIQVASFVRDANATKLINKLRAQSLPAYANRVQGSTRTVVRVLVGPYGNQIDALALQNRINRDYRVESLMVRQR